ncbi:acyl-CoA dehydrogenase family protein [Iamia majanohamensis]|uniref:Acyl-CoA dehydrogenase family protein n=1 Tax=Iamia majanohamensis TaxID=467976 RepID=A0AAE9Y4H5_9ACTN|nr:acyl-CoA dehydrogenase family protein [Iamia majanohamensis]WCO66102.1 acyl-CoA dehydrogenase family protein [Iamia majanohamensis]
MDFDDTPEEASFRAEARAWLDAHAPAKGSPEDFSQGYLEGTADVADHVARAKAWQRTLFDHGWAGITWPREYGGRGAGAVESMIWGAEMARYGVNVGPFAVGIGMAGPTILRHGTDAQKERFLVPMLKGEEMWCQLFSEPEAGSDLASLRTRAVPDGDEWVVTGQKVWTSGAEVADWGMLLARTDLDATKRKGITYFLVDMATPGIERRPLRQMTGSSHFSEVFLDEVRIPADQVLGEVHQGWAVTATTLANERGLIAGGNKASDAVALCELAAKLGRGDDPALRQALVDCWIRQRIQAYHGYRLQTALSQGRQPGPETSIMKLFAAEYLRRLGAAALATLGADGMRAGEGPGGGDWQARFLHAPAIGIAGGSNEVQRNIIGERVLGLPREAPADDVPFRELVSGRRERAGA